MISSVLAGLSGVIAISRFSLANVSFGQDGAGSNRSFSNWRYSYDWRLWFNHRAALGAGIMGMVRLFSYGRCPSYWYNAFVGIILVIAAVVNLKLEVPFWENKEVEMNPKQPLVKMENIQKKFERLEP